MGNGASQSVNLKVLVDEEKNRVVFAESDNDFVDVLFSFMTMPLGNIIRLTREQALKWEIGCLNNLYESIENLDDKDKKSVRCKDMVLRPRSAAEIYCRKLKLNFVNSTTSEFEYYACEKGCTLIPYQTAYCHCGSPIFLRVKLQNALSGAPVGGVFVKPNSRFIISDDIQVRPMSTMTCLTLLEAVDGSTLKERCIKIGKDEVLKLLMCSLTSMAPFSETVLDSPVNKTIFEISRGEFSTRSTNQTDQQRAMHTTKRVAKIALKLIINKSTNRALYAEAKEDFIDLISNFLTIPLGYVFKEFPCLSMRGCLGNIYKSIQDLDVEFLKSEVMKSTLVNPKLAPGIAYNKQQLIPIEEALYPSISTAVQLFKCIPSISTVATTAGWGFQQEFFEDASPSMFMVTDNLTITPLSPISSLSLINRLNIPISDIVEQKVIIGEEEALRLLETAFVSGSALTDAFILKEPKQKPRA